MRVLVIDEWIPLPLESGKKIRTFQLLSPLARRHEITYLCYADPAAEREKIARMEDAGFRMVCVPPARRFKSAAGLALGLAGNLLRRAPLAVRRHYSPRFRRALLETLSGRSFDVVHCEWTHYAQYLKAASRVPRFLSSHNVESMQWRRLSQVQTNPLRRAAIRLECVKMLAFERRALGMFDHVAAVSAEDARIMESCFGARSVEIIPNGVDLGYYDQGGGDDGTETIVYCGSMDYFPNQDAALHFARKILPRIRGRRARARFLVLGRSPPASIRALANDHIAVSGTVDDVRPYLSSATVSVVPLRVAGGSRLKILESFAAGVPVVSTSIGAEGLGLRHGAELLIADDETAFAAECVRLLEQPRLREQISRTAKTHLNHNCDWRAIAPLVEAAWERTRCNFLRKIDPQPSTC